MIDEHDFIFSSFSAMSVNVNPVLVTWSLEINSEGSISDNAAVNFLEVALSRFIRLMSHILKSCLFEFSIIYFVHGMQGVQRSHNGFLRRAFGELKALFIYTAFFFPLVCTC